MKRTTFPTSPSTFHYSKIVIGNKIFFPPNVHVSLTGFQNQIKRSMNRRNEHEHAKQMPLILRQKQIMQRVLSNCQNVQRMITLVSVQGQNSEKEASARTVVGRQAAKTKVARPDGMETWGLVLPVTACNSL